MHGLIHEVLDTVASVVLHGASAAAIAATTVDLLVPRGRPGAALHAADLCKQQRLRIRASATAPLLLKESRVCCDVRDVSDVRHDSYPVAAVIVLLTVCCCCHVADFQVGRD